MDEVGVILLSVINKRMLNNHIFGRELFEKIQLEIHSISVKEIENIKSCKYNEKAMQFLTGGNDEYI